MSIRVLKAGLQTTLQGAPFIGHRHIGMPAAGAADCLSLALANFLVGKPSGAIALEITLTEAIFQVNVPCAIAVVGAAAYVRINDHDRPQHETLKLAAGDRIQVGPSSDGCRTYLAVSQEILAHELLDGQSTYLAASLGGFHGRALETEDVISFEPSSANADIYRATPPALRPHFGGSHILRVIPGPEVSNAGEGTLNQFCLNPYTVGARNNRMGVALEGRPLPVNESSNMQSAAVFSGTIQMPASGEPYLLGPDAQTTGGYPRIAQVIRADRHLIGQLRSGSKTQFVQTTTERATEIYREKLSLLSPWLGRINLW